MLERLHCPIGLPGVGTKLPAEIAIAVAAQILAARETPVKAPDAMAVAPAEGATASGCATPGCDAPCISKSDLSKGLTPEF